MIPSAERGINWTEQFRGFRDANIKSSIAYEGGLLIFGQKDPMLFLIAAIPGGFGIAVEFIARKRAERKQSAKIEQIPPVQAAAEIV